MTAVWAHRGASAAAPENTVAAFAAAVAMGADGVELDVRLTVDGAPAIHHDAVLPDGRRIADIPAAALPGGVPLLGAALDACDGVVVNIEIKEPHEAADVVVAEVRRRRWHDRVVVSAFDRTAVDRVRHLDAAVPVAWLVLDVPPGALDECRAAGYHALHPYEAVVDADLVESAHRAGVALNTWTVDDPARIVALAAMGVDAVVTNVPDVALRALGR